MYGLSGSQALRAHREKKLYDASVELFAEKGFRRTSVDEICAGIGTSPGTLYRTFGSKKELLDLVVQNEVGQFLGTWAHLGDTGRLSADLVRWAERVLRWQHGRGAARLYVEAMAEAAVDDDLREDLTAMHRSLETRLVRRIRLASERGEIAEDIDAERVAAVIQRIISAAPGDWIVLNPMRLSDRIHEVQRAIIALVGDDGPRRLRSPLDGG